MILRTGDKVRMTVVPSYDMYMLNAEGTVVETFYVGTIERAHIKWNNSGGRPTDFAADRTHQEDPVRGSGYCLKIIPELVCEND